MKCPYTDIGCRYIDDVTHDCEAESMSQCYHARRKPEQSSEEEKEDEEE